STISTWCWRWPIGYLRSNAARCSIRVRQVPCSTTWVTESRFYGFERASPSRWCGLLEGFKSAKPPGGMSVMKLKRIALALAAFVSLAGLAQAQGWPERTITLIVPFAAGGGIDASARVQALALAEVLKQSVVVENIGAAGGTVGTARAAK